MKAAVIHEFGQTPRYEDFPDPVPAEGETLVRVQASVLENFDKVTALGTHYSSKHLYPAFPAIVGRDGIGLTEDGRLVGFGGLKPPYGSFAEKAAVSRIIPLPEGIDPAEAAAMPRSVLTCLLALKYSARLQPGETVLINGATGVSGRMSVQLARMLGAGKVVGTGRNEKSLALLSGLGADSVIPLPQPDEALADAFTKEGPYDVVIDFLWGHPTEVLLNTFIPNFAGFPRKQIRYVQIGDKAGAHISIPAPVLRTSGVAMMGMGVISNEVLATEMEFVWKGIQEKRFFMEIERIPLADIGKAWERTDLNGKRLVIIP